MISGAAQPDSAASFVGSRPRQADGHATRAGASHRPQSDTEDIEASILETVKLASRLRLTRGRLAASLLSRRAWSVLGFARAGDYCRERLGIGVRTFEDDARVARALQTLPLLADALLASSLSWTKVRLVSTVANADDQSAWIAIARQTDTRTLASKIQSSGARRSTPEEDDEPRVAFCVTIPRCGRRLWRVAGEVAERVAGSSLTAAQVLELVAAEAGSAASSAGATSGDGATASHERREQARNAPPPEPCFPVPPGIFLHASDGRRRQPDAERTAKVDADVDPFAIDRQLRDNERAMQRLDADIGVLLVRALEQRLHRRSGFRRFADYVEERLGFCARKAWMLIAIERAAGRNGCELASAYREGRLSHLAAATLLPVVGSPFTEAWIERARTVTLRRLEHEVAWALDQRDASDTDDASAIPAPPPFDLDVHAEKFAGLCDGTIAAAAVAAAEATAAAADPDGGVQMRAHAGEVELRMFVPVSIAALAEQTMRRTGVEPRGIAFLCMVSNALGEWLSAPRHRDPIFERDGWCCAVPGCRSRRNLHDHHVQFRSHGGGNAADNRITVCASHHQHGLHGGRIRARGVAPHGIVWDMPLGRFFGDRYAA